MGVRDVIQQTALDEEDAVLLDKIAGDLPILADISRSDVQIFCRASSGSAQIIAQAGPHSVKPIYAADLVATTIDVHSNPDIIQLPVKCSR
jgi:hypothetical protein